MITLYHCADARPFPALWAARPAFQRVKQAQAGGPGSALAWS